MTHEIPQNVKNSEIIEKINEYVRKERDRDILKDHWFGGMSFMAISNKYDMSLTSVKSVIYSIGDAILQKVT